MLQANHPDLFDKAVQYEQLHKDGRTYTWTQGETLLELVARRDDIITDHQISLTRQQQTQPNRSLSEALAAVLDKEEDTLPCLACHL